MRYASVTRVPHFAVGVVTDRKSLTEEQYDLQ